MGATAAAPALGSGILAPGAPAAGGASFGAVSGGIGLGLMAGMSILQGIQQNKAIKSANAAAIKADAANKAYLDVSRQSNQSKLGKAYSKYVAREAALSSAKGTYGSASSTAAQMSALANALVDSGVIDFNTRAQKDQSAGVIGNQIRQNSANYQNPLWSGISSGAQGLQMGYQLGGVIKEAYYGQ